MRLDKYQNASREIHQRVKTHWQFRQGVFMKTSRAFPKSSSSFWKSSVKFWLIIFQYSIMFLSRKWDSNPRLAHYEWATLPTELFRQTIFFRRWCKYRMFFSEHKQKAENFGSPLFILCQWDDLESHSEDTFLVVMADDFEGSYFGSVFYMLADAKTFVIVAYMNHTNRVGCSFGQALHVEASHRFLLGDELHGHRQVLAEGFVHNLFYSAKAKSSLLFLRSIWADTALPHPKRLTMVRLTTCSQVWLGLCSSLLWAFNTGWLFSIYLCLVCSWVQR